jgi:hypothetical protein
LYFFHTWHIQVKQCYTTKVDLKNYLHVENPTFNLFLQCKIWKLMHNNEDVACFYNSSKNIECVTILR